MRANGTVDVRENRGANPPLLTGGLIQGAKALSRGVDGVTATVATLDGATLLAETWPDEDGYAGRGFHKSERRLCMGGKLWRRWEPFQASEAWGREYESWDVLGDGSWWVSERLRSIPSRPSRFDLAWDFQVSNDLTPDTVADLVKLHVEEAGFTLGISGQGNRNTRYIGAASSPRRVCIYRKDWETIGYGEMWGHVLRVELRLRAEHAQAIWPIWCADKEAGFQAAAGHLAEMMGVRVQEHLQAVPQILQPDGVDEAAELFQFAKQHGARIDTWLRAGVDLAKVAKLAAESSSRMTKHRMARKAKALAAAGVPCVVAQVVNMLTPRPA